MSALGRICSHTKCNFWVFPFYFIFSPCLHHQGLCSVSHLSRRYLGRHASLLSTRNTLQRTDAWHPKLQRWRRLIINYLLARNKGFSLRDRFCKISNNVLVTQLTREQITKMFWSEKEFGFRRDFQLTRQLSQSLAWAVSDWILRVVKDFWDGESAENAIVLLTVYDGKRRATRLKVTLNAVKGGKVEWLASYQEVQWILSCYIPREKEGSPSGLRHWMNSQYRYFSL